MALKPLYTTLSVWGAPGPSPAVLLLAASTTDTVSVTLTESSLVVVASTITTSDTVNVSVSESSTLVQNALDFQRTLLGVGGSPVTYYDTPDRLPSLLVPITSSDTISVQWNEDPITSNTITSQDVTTRISVSESSQLFNVVLTGDTSSVTVSETVALVQVAATPITTSDTISTTLTEASAVSVTVVTTDTTSVTLTDSSSLLTSAQSVVASDTVSASLTEASLLAIFTGILQFQSIDELDIAVSEVSAVEQIADRRPMAIRIIPLHARISITPL
jgi:hypothetical protein